ncbi:TPA: radical SAM protein [Candidatus Woesearchaeota archaeon]|nr:Radical SAM protein [archaeon GW2011_AR15]MBS3103503.1 radical SAM protein [Candidatus Woesearchaeota archaeon]HIH41621.1 radical SAM protein [Candidatus Woesearchaeota archaeon]
MNEKKKILFIKYFTPANFDQRTIGAILNHRYDVSYLTILSDDGFKSLKGEKTHDRENYRKLGKFCSNYDFILIGALSFDEKRIFEFITYLNRNYPDLRLLLGGPLAMAEPEKCLKYVDYLCIWDAYNIMQLFDYIETGKFPEGGLDNFVIKGKNEFPGLSLPKTYDEYPVPDFASEENYSYLNGKLMKLGKYTPKMVYFETEKGCIFNCSFCSISHYNKIKRQNKMPLVVKSSMIVVLEKLRKIKSNLRKDACIDILDDNFFVYSEEEIQYFVDHYDKEIGLPVIIQTDPRSENFIEKFRIISKIKNMKVFACGIQTGSEQFNLRVYNRSQKNKLIIDNHRSMKKIMRRQGVKFTVLYYIIYNNPLEKREDVLDTINLMLNLRGKEFEFQLNAYSLIPSTILGERLKDYYNDIYTFRDPQFNVFRKNAFYNLFLFIINKINFMGADFLLPSKFKENIVTELLNNKFLAKPYYKALINATYTHEKRRLQKEREDILKRATIIA